MNEMEWNPLATTKKEHLKNDLVRLQGLIKGEQKFISKELLELAKKEYKRILKMYEEEK